MDQGLQVFVHVVEKENFSRAAEELHMTQPAVSQYIRSLEETIGTRLLERTNKYVRLNKAGEIVYHHAKEILGLYTNMQALVDDLVHKASGPLSIGASYTFGEYVLPPMLAKLQSMYPDIQPALHIANTAEVAHFVATHQLDVGIVEGHFKDFELHVEEFAEDEMVLVAASNHVLTEKEEVTAKDLESARWIVREKGSGTKEAVEKVFQQLVISPKKRMNFSSTQSIKGAVEAGLGITLLSQWTIQKELENAELSIIPVSGLPFKREFSIITKSPFQTKALEVFIELLRNDESLVKYIND